MLIDGCGPSLEQSVMQELQSSLFLSHVQLIFTVRSVLRRVFHLHIPPAEAFGCEMQQGLFVCFLFRSDSLNVYYLQITGHTHINS